MTSTAHYLPGNALRALGLIGVSEEVRAAAHPISRRRVTGSGGRALDWRHYFADLGKPIIDLLDQAGQACGAPIMEVDQQYAVLGRMVLVGDAAHAMSPSMAQGVGLALEDALVLTETLSSLPVS
jgi:hypothetical protein